MDTKKLIEKVRRNSKTPFIVSKEYERDVLALCKEADNLLREIEDPRQHVLELAK
jgi:hypothetical protein